MRSVFVYDLGSVFSAQIRQAETEVYRVFEPVIGLVTDNQDPQKLGRVKVKYPVMKGDGAEDTSWWTPIIMLGAGKNRGWFFIPEKDDEVLVMFEQGDFTRPLIVGALWNGKDKPPEKNGGGNPKRLIKSRAGSKITFDDDGKKITIEDGGNAGIITIDAGSNKITIEAKAGDVCFQAPQGEIEITAKSSDIKAEQGNLEVVTGTTLQWGSSGSVNLKGGSSMTLSGSQSTQNGGNSSAPSAPSPSPADVADPYGS
ncbi:MAG TPA: phage baseplate assembly protein V [Kofleriaceae bacterium]|jgi:uncharacterized protein involved in type VI secretion and phage assembly